MRTALPLTIPGACYQAGNSFQSYLFSSSHAPKWDATGRQFSENEKKVSEI